MLDISDTFLYGLLQDIGYHCGKENHQVSIIFFSVFLHFK